MLLVIASCSGRLERALKMSGENRSELEAVLGHYAHDPLKKDAARWLIENMPGHVSVGGDYALYCDTMDSLLAKDRVFADYEEFEAFWGEIVSLEKQWHPRIRYVRDIELMDSSTLVRNIDAAFAAWQGGEWATHLDYHQFREWLLPYKCFEGQPLFDWRDSLKSFAAGDLEHLNECYEYLNNPRAAITCVSKELERLNKKEEWGSAPGGYPVLRPSTYVRFPKSTCADDCRITDIVVKSKGIPISLDFITQWPDKALNHIWCAYPSIRGGVEEFDPFMSSPGSSFYPYSRYAKVFRWSYEPFRKKVPSEIFKNPFFKDVTRDYMQTSDLCVRLNKKRLSFGDRVFIAVFNDNRWVPVWWGSAWLGRGFFKNMGRRITYIVLDDNLVPVSDPFEVDALGNIHYFRSAGQETEDFRITRKYPLYDHVFEISALLKGGRIEASNDPLFHSSEIVAQFPDWPLAAASAQVSQSRPYRYWRFCAEEGEISDMDEIFFYDSAEGKPLEVKCIPASSKEFTHMFDGSTLTNYRAEGSRFDGAVDLGTPKVLDHVSFLRRGDGNVVFPGDVYRVSYWNDGKWNLHAEIKAKDIYLEIKGIPSGTLYFVEDITSGFQERIFTVKSGNEEIVWH